MGAATTYQLAKAGTKVLGIDQYSPPHANGSSHGDTRFTRLAVGEGAEYAPLAIRSHEIWREIEREANTRLLVEAGGLIMFAGKDTDPVHNTNDFIANSQSIVQQFGIDHELLGIEEIKNRFPAFNLTGTEEALYEPGAGYVFAEESIKAQLNLAKKYGATLHLNERVESYKEQSGHVTATTNKDIYTASKLVICGGPWVADFLPEYAQDFRVYRQVLYWFGLNDTAAYNSYKDIPVFAWAFPGGFFYGFPAIDGERGGIKVATEEYEHSTTPEQLDRTVRQDEIDRMFALIHDRLPGVTAESIRAEACMYTVTPDHKFVIDYHPEYPNVIIVSPCSGHGFKHSAAIGELLAQLSATGKASFDISKFSLRRFEQK